MKKIFGIFLLVLFIVSLAFSINNELNSGNNNDNTSPGYASIVPIPPPEPPARRGC